jgi:hypothetical protein
MGATAIYMPKIFTMFSSFAMALLALLGMSGFVAKFLVFLGIILNQKKFHHKDNTTNRISVFSKDVGSWVVCPGKGRRHLGRNVWDLTLKGREGTLLLSLL